MAAEQVDQLPVRALRIFATTPTPEPGLAFLDGKLQPIEGGGWNFKPQTNRQPLDFRHCHSYIGCAYRFRSTDEEKKGTVDDPASDAYWDKIIDKYLDTMWFDADGLLVFFLVNLDLLLRRVIPPEGLPWIIMPNDSDWGKSLWNDFLADKLGADPFKTFRSPWLENEETLRAEGLAIATELIVKLPELRGKVLNNMWKNLPAPHFRQLLRLPHSGKCIWANLAYMLRIIEVNPKNRGAYAFADENDDPDAVAKRGAVVRKRRGCFKRRGPYDEEQGVFPITAGLRAKIMSDGARRAFWRRFQKETNKWSTPQALAWMNDLAGFDETHGTTIHADTAELVKEMGVKTRTAPADDGEEMPPGAVRRTGYQGDWNNADGLQPSRVAGAQAARIAKSIEERDGKWMERKTWHQGRKCFTGTHVWYPNYFPDGLEIVPPSYGKRGKMHYTQQPNAAGGRFHLLYGKDCRPDQLQGYLQRIDPVTGIVEMHYKFYDVLEGRDEGSRRMEIGAGPQKITQEGRGSVLAPLFKQLDVENCDFVMWLLGIRSIPFATPPPLPHLERIVTDRAVVLAAVDPVRAVAKKTTLKSGYALRPFHPSLKGLCSDLQLRAELFAQAYPDLYQHLEDRATQKLFDDEEAKDPRKTLLAYRAHDVSNAVGVWSFLVGLSPVPMDRPSLS